MKRMIRKREDMAPLALKIISSLICIGLMISACSQNPVVSEPAETSAPVVTIETTSLPTQAPTPSLSPTEPPVPTPEVPSDLTACITTSDPAGEYGCLVTTIAGGADDSGDGGAATEAYLGEPHRVLVSDDGLLYISDLQNNKIRVVTPQGVMATLAGVGPSEGLDPLEGFAARETPLRRPTGMAIGPDGLLYFAANKNHRVFRIEKDGTIRLIAGGGVSIAEGGSLGDGLPAVRAALFHPSDLAFDEDGNLYISDTSHHLIRKIDKQGIITTVLGQDFANRFPYPEGTIANPEVIAFGPDGKLYICNTHEITVLDVATGETNVIDGTAGANAVAFLTTGEMIFSKPAFHNVYKRNLDGAVERIAGTGTHGFSGDGELATSAQLFMPRGLAVDGMDNIYIVDSYNHRIRRVDPRGNISTFAGSGPKILDQRGVPPESVSIGSTQGMTFDSYGNMYFSDFDHQYIFRMDTDAYISIVAGQGVVGLPPTLPVSDFVHPLSAYLDYPRALTFDHFGNLFFMGHTGIVQRITPGADGIINGSPDEVIQIVAGQSLAFEESGKEVVDGIRATQAVISSIRGLAFDSSGNLYIADWEANLLLKVTPGEDGIINAGPDEFISIIAGNGTRGFGGDGGPAVDAQLAYPWWVDIDSEDNIYLYEYLASGSAQVIRKIDSSTGNISRFTTTEGPTTFAFDHKDNLYLANSFQVFMVDAETGQKIHIAGQRKGGYSGIPGGFAGDRGDARQALFNGISYLTVDGCGNVYVNDTANYRIRKITFVPLTPDIPECHIPEEILLDPSANGVNEAELTPIPTSLPDLIKIMGMVPDSSVCPGNENLIAGQGIQCLGKLDIPSISQETIYAFRIVGFEVGVQPVEVLDSLDARSNCGRKQWGRFDIENGQIMWIELNNNSGRCTVSLNLPGDVSVESELVLD